MATLLRKLTREGPKKDRALYQEMLANFKPLIGYLERQEEIEAASAALEAHREEFERLADDESAYFARTRSLFGEERFAPLRFTAADIRRTFDRVGYPIPSAPPDETRKTLLAAILFLADKNRRSELSMSLLSHLPDYVKAGRPLDGWLIQHCAHETMEGEKGSNPFLFEMFAHGYDAWVSEEREKDESMIRQIGLDPARLQEMNFDEIDAWLAEQQADPAKKAWLEAVMANPEQRDKATVGLEQLERDSITLLEREDARRFLVPPAEIEPWLPGLLKRWAKVEQRFGGKSDRTPSQGEVAATAKKVILPVVTEMASTIFAPERIRQLVSELRKYRDERFAAGDKHTAGCAMGAIVSLEGPVDPAHNYFLVSLCYASLRALMNTLAQPGAGEPQPSPEEPTA